MNLSKRFAKAMKHILREQMKVLRSSIKHQYQLTASEAILTRVAQILKAKSFGFDKVSVGLYWPMKGEPDLLKLSLYDNANYALPKLNGHEMDFVLYRNCDPVQNSHFAKIMEPVSYHKIIPQILLMPALSYDIKGNRLGFGGGYYDRYLNLLPSHLVPLKIGVCFHEYIREKLPYDNNDVSVDYLITEQTLIELHG